MNKRTTGLVLAGLAIIGGWCLYRNWQRSRDAENAGGNSNFVRRGPTYRKAACAGLIGGAYRHCCARVPNDPACNGVEETK